MKRRKGKKKQKRSRETRGTEAEDHVRKAGEARREKRRDGREEGGN